MHVVCQTPKTFTPAHPHTLTLSHKHTYTRVNSGNAIYMPSTGCGSGSAALFALAERLRARLNLRLQRHLRLRPWLSPASAAPLCMLCIFLHSWLWSVHLASQAETQAPHAAPPAPPASCHCCLQRLHCNAAASSARARFLAACMCESASVCLRVCVCLCVRVLFVLRDMCCTALCTRMCVCLCVCQHSAAGILIRKTNSALHSYKASEGERRRSRERERETQELASLSVIYAF